ncbi:MAG: type II toxin-antitoxin system Phd/YefM family antitoxin [Acidobacteriota bacterium]|nr:type II toxin-antitoxin system Phd/YefM family antitoxin [Acidobacteriota bacterium]
MKTVGIFEAKTRLSEICDEVARSGQGVVVTRRGKPLVRIDPVKAEGLSVWEDRAEYIAARGPIREDFDVPPRSRELPASPLDD